MKEDKLLDNLWEAAREEKSQVSYEEVAKKFQAALPAAAGLGGLAWFWKYLSLNNVLWVSGLSAVSVVAWLSLSPNDNNPKPQTLTSNPIHEKTILPAPPDSTLKVESPAQIDTLVTAPLSAAIEKEVIVIRQDYPSDSSETKPIIQLEEPKAPVKSELAEEHKSDSINQAGTVIETADHQAPPRLALDHSLPKWTQFQTEKTFLITKDDGEAKVKEFFEQLWVWGLMLHKKSNYRYQKSQLHFLYLWFKHEKGLNFKLKGHGFDKFEIKVNLGRKGQVETFSYRFNQEKFTKDIPLNCVGHKTYSYGPGFRGMSGTTSINIEN